MRQIDVDMHLAEYRIKSSQRDQLQAEITWMEASLQELEDEGAGPMLRAVVPDGMPHASGYGDPTARYGMMLTDAKDLKAYQELSAALREARKEYAKLQYECRIVDAWLAGLTEKHRIVIKGKVIGGQTWREVGEALARQTGKKNYSREGMRRLCAVACENLYAIAGCNLKKTTKLA